MLKQLKVVDRRYFSLDVKVHCTKDTLKPQGLTWIVKIGETCHYVGGSVSAKRNLLKPRHLRRGEQNSQLATTYAFLIPPSSASKWFTLLR